MPDITPGTNPRAAAAGGGYISVEPGGGSAVSWAAILAGAAGAAALSLILVILGTGFGFTAVSPWSMEGLSASKIGFAAIIWLSFTQIAASGMGGYLAGRLRTKWAATHSDEVYFRDTAHGFLTWAIATLLTAALLTTAVGTIVSGAAKVGAEVAGGAASVGATALGGAAAIAASQADTGNGADDSSNTIEYYIDSLFRGTPAVNANSEQQGTQRPTGEVMRIVMQALRSGELPQQDQRHIGQLIAQQTTLSQQDAEQRVANGFQELQSTLEQAENAVREAADEARKASAYAALWMFITLLMGAFIASLMAVYGGRQRDE